MNQQPPEGHAKASKLDLSLDLTRPLQKPSNPQKMFSKSLKDHHPCVLFCQQWVSPWNHTATTAPLTHMCLSSRKSKYKKSLQI